MELFKIISENLGGREMERTFKNYFILSLLLKQLIFSLFATPVDLFDLHSIPAQEEQIPGDNVTGGSSEEALNRVETFRLLFTLGTIEPENTSSSN